MTSFVWAQYYCTWVQLSNVLLPRSLLRSCLHVICELSCSVVSDSLRPRGLEPARILCPWDSSDKYWSGLNSLLQGILLTQRLNLGLLHCWWILYHLSYQGSPGVTLIPCQDSWKPINKKEEQGTPYFVEAVCNHWQLRD